MDAADAIEFCDEVLADLEDLPERAAEFTESVRETVEGIRANVEEFGNVTEWQEVTLENMRNGIDRWLRR